MDTLKLPTIENNVINIQFMNNPLYFVKFPANALGQGAAKKSWGLIKHKLGRPYRFYKYQA